MFKNCATKSMIFFACSVFIILHGSVASAWDAKDFSYNIEKPKIINLLRNSDFDDSYKKCLDLSAPFYYNLPHNIVGQHLQHFGLFGESFITKIIEVCEDAVDENQIDDLLALSLGRLYYAAAGGITRESRLNKAVLNSKFIIRDPRDKDERKVEYLDKALFFLKKAGLNGDVEAEVILGYFAFVSVRGLPAARKKPSISSYMKSYKARKIIRESDFLSTRTKNDIIINKSISQDQLIGLSLILKGAALKNPLAMHTLASASSDFCRSHNICFYKSESYFFKEAESMQYYPALLRKATYGFSRLSGLFNKDYPNVVGLSKEGYIPALYHIANRFSGMTYTSSRPDISTKIFHFLADELDHTASQYRLASYYNRGYESDYSYLSYSRPDYENYIKYLQKIVQKGERAAEFDLITVLEKQAKKDKTFCGRNPTACIIGAVIGAGVVMNLLSESSGEYSSDNLTCSRQCADDNGDKINPNFGVGYEQIRQQCYSLCENR